MQASVSEIHRQALRPEGHEEPLFLGARDKKEIAEHIRESASWLRKASEARAREDRAGEPCHVLRRPDGSAYLVSVEPKRAGCRRRGRGSRARKRRVRGVIERWREVREWWEPGGGVDRVLFRVELAGGAVLDLCLDRRSGSWSVAGLVD